MFSQATDFTTSVGDKHAQGYLYSQAQDARNKYTTQYILLLHYNRSYITLLKSDNVIVVNPGNFF